MNFDKLEHFLYSLNSEYGVPACEIRVPLNHKIVYNKKIGGGDKKIYSTTKQITCVGALRLMEEGKMSLDDTLETFIPEFANMKVKAAGKIIPAKKKIQMKDLFTMCAGFHYNVDMEPILRLRRQNPGASTLDVVKAIAQEPLEFEPSTHFKYSLCHDVLAGVVEVVSGMRFSEYLEKHIFSPLNMTDTTFKPSEEILKYMFPQFCYNEQTGAIEKEALCNRFVLTPEYESGGAGLISTADDSIKFADALANEGVSARGYRLLRPETVAMMKQNQVTESIVPETVKSYLGYGGAWG